MFYQWSCYEHAHIRIMRLTFKPDKNWNFVCSVFSLISPVWTDSQLMIPLWFKSFALGHLSKICCNCACLRAFPSYIVFLRWCRHFGRFLIWIQSNKECLNIDHILERETAWRFPISRVIFSGIFGPACRWCGGGEVSTSTFIHTIYPQSLYPLPRKT